MNNDDRDYLRLLEKKMDEQHGALVTLVTTEFERASRHMSKQNDRTTKLECQTSVWRLIQNNPVISIPFLLLGLGFIIALVDLIGVVNIFK